MEILLRAIVNNMKFLVIILFILSSSLCASEYNLSWYPKDNYFDSIKTPDDIKFSLINTEGVWEDNKGSFGVMSCLISLLTNSNKETELEGFCQANDDSKDETKFWVTLKRSSKETSAGVGKITYIAGTGIYKKVIGMSCPYAVNYVGESHGYGMIKQKCSEEFFRRLK